MLFNIKLLPLFLPTINEHNSHSKTSSSEMPKKSNAARKQDYFKHCKTLNPQSHYSLHSTAILHLKYLDMHTPQTAYKKFTHFFQPQPQSEKNSYLVQSDSAQTLHSTTDLHSNSSTTQMTVYGDRDKYQTHPHPHLDSYIPINTCPEVLSNPYLIQSHPFPPAFFLLNRFSIRSHPRLAPPPLRIVYKLAPDYEKRRILLRNTKEECLDCFETCGEVLARRIMKKSLIRKVGIVRKFAKEEFVKRFTSIPVVGSPLKECCDLSEDVRRDSKMSEDTFIPMVKSKSYGSVRLKSWVKQRVGSARVGVDVGDIEHVRMGNVPSNSAHTIMNEEYVDAKEGIEGRDVKSSNLWRMLASVGRFIYQ